MDATLREDRRDLAERVARSARQHGLVLRISDEVVNLELDDRRHTWRAAWSTDGRGRDVAARAVADTFLLADRLSPVAAERVRRAGGGFADALGNLYVRAPGLLVDVRGRRQATSRAGAGEDGPGVSRARPAPSSRNLMSAARAQVVFCLLEWPELLRSSVRLLADAAGVSVGSAQSTLAALDAERHVTVGRSHLTRRAELVDQWAAAFPAGLGRRLELGRFVGEPTPDAWTAAGHLVHVSGEYAAEHISGNGMTIYVDGLDARAVMASRWRRPANGEEANVVVRHRFWRSPAAESHPARDRVLRAPELLVYADLLASGEPRQREAARNLRAQLV